MPPPPGTGAAGCAAGVVVAAALAIAGTEGGAELLATAGAVATLAPLGATGPAVEYVPEDCGGLV